MRTGIGLPAAIVAAITTLACAGWSAGCGGGSDEGADVPGSTSASTAQTARGDTAERAPGQAADRGDAIDLYFTAGEQFRRVAADLPAGEPGLVAAARALAEGPPDGGRVTTQLPEGLVIEDVSVDGTTATVEASAEFMRGIPAQPGDRSDIQRQELAARLGQLTYTLTQFGRVRAVEVVSGGEPVATEATRGDFAQPDHGPRRETHEKGPQSAGTRRLQERLAELQYLPRSAVDGIEGYRTRQAVIAFQSWEGLQRDGIVGPATTAALERARPPRPGRRGPARRVEVYRARGVALLIARGRTKRAIHVSAGAAATPTPAGTFEVFRKELRSWSVPFQVWLPYASYFTGGIAFHEYPDVPVYPASHGCVRVPAPEAQIVYRFAKLGTAVVVR